jgi:putative ABC transport system permease protein
LYWPDTNPIGQKIRVGQQTLIDYPRYSDAGSVLTIAGVAADAKQLRIIEAAVRPQFFVPLYQRPAEMRAPTLLVRAWLNADSLANAVRGAVVAVDPEMPVYAVNTMDQIVVDAAGPKRLTMTLLTFFAGLAVVLVIVGFYAVVAYGVGERTQEIGLRMALGASPGNILRLILCQGMGLAIFGLAVGLLASFGLTQALNSMLYGVGANDPPTLAFAIGLLLFVTVIACCIPARRAMRMDPMVALRHE